MNRPFNAAYIGKAFVSVIPYIGVTFAVVAGTVLFGMILSLILVKQKFSRHRFVRGLASGYINVLRCTPSIVLLFIVFYGIPKLFLVAFHVNINFWPKIIFVVISLSLLYSASLAEIIRSALLSVGNGQYEAAITIGLTPFQAMYRIIIPQAFVVALPNLGNSLIALFKEGSLAYTIGLIDLVGGGNLFISRNYGAYALETYIALAGIYWGLTFLIEKLFALLEKKFSKGRRSL